MLGLVVTDHLYGEFPTLPEGALAKIRASVVSTPVLAEVALAIDLGDSLRLGRGEDQSGGRQKPSILADALEAVFGAVYLDGGLRAASPLVVDLLGEHLLRSSAGPGGEDHKTRLQELAVGRWEVVPGYDIEASGPDHDKRFRAVVRLGELVEAEGRGRSKKEAEQAAARAALDRLVGASALDEDGGGTRSA